MTLKAAVQVYSLITLMALLMIPILAVVKLKPTSIPIS
jgi:hypothetical protein